MKTKEEYFADCREEEKRKDIERQLKWRNEILEEITEWSYVKLKEEYIKVRLSRISYGGSFAPGMMWDWCKEECRFCDLEYIQGRHDSCCDNCSTDSRRLCD